MRDVYVLGIGMTRFGELWASSFRDLFVEAALEAIGDAETDRLDSMYIGCMSGGLFVGQEHIGALMADYLGRAPIPATRVESACASGGAAVRLAYLEVASGASEIVLASGVEKMTDGADVTAALATAADQEYEVYHGVTFPGLYALMARAHMFKYGTTREQLAQVAVKNHYHGTMNPNAQYPFEITVEQVLASSMVADPLRLLDCSPVTDGAAAVILASEEIAKKAQAHPLVRIAASAQASGALALHDRDDITYLDTVAKASQLAYQQARITPEKVDVTEVHDCFTIAELCVMEALDYTEPGKAANLVEAGETRIGGRMPINTSGGLKAKGHPVGASGVAQIAEITAQLRGEAGDRQVAEARIGLAQNMGGTGASCTVHILEGLA
ncbi:MAG: thiolase domain-containing protein [Fidelibacterota bacterium]|nr:MAG: thiolase domain-containing protein [Candidatus Neomarinimicrobiota bacterium]